MSIKDSGPVSGIQSTQQLGDIRITIGSNFERGWIAITNNDIPTAWHGMTPKELLVFLDELTDMRSKIVEYMNSKDSHSGSTHLPNDFRSVNPRIPVPPEVSRRPD